MTQTKSLTAISTLSAGPNTPHEFYAIIEISALSTPVKYEVDKNNGLITVDRFLEVPMQYPCNYGYIPSTLGGDGDPLDVLVVTPYPIQSSAVIQCRPIGMLRMNDDGGEDAKILAVPVNKLTSQYQEVKTPNDLPQSLLQAIRYFFEHYKDLDKGKWVTLAKEWSDSIAACSEITASIARYKQSLADE